MLLSFLEAWVGCLHQDILVATKTLSEILYLDQRDVSSVLQCEEGKEVNYYYNVTSYIYSQYLKSYITFCQLSDIYNNNEEKSNVLLKYLCCAFSITA